MGNNGLLIETRNLGKAYRRVAIIHEMYAWS